MNNNDYNDNSDDNNYQSCLDDKNSHINGNNNKIIKYFNQYGSNHS